MVREIQGACIAKSHEEAEKGRGNDLVIANHLPINATGPKDCTSARSSFLARGNRRNGIRG